MDRLSLVIGLAALAAIGCGDETGGESAVEPRVQTVLERGPTEADVAAFCDVRTTASDAPTLTWPPLASDAPATHAGWRWINVWATWCRPCVEEIPLVQRWVSELDGVQLVLLSADLDDDAVARFIEVHPATPAGPRLRDPAALEAFLRSVGLDAASSIPVHVFVDPTQRVRCVRAGAISEGDRAVVRRLLTR